MRVRVIQSDQAGVCNRMLHVLRRLLVSPEIFPLRFCQDLYPDEIYEQAAWRFRDIRAL